MLSSDIGFVFLYMMCLIHDGFYTLYYCYVIFCNMIIIIVGILLLYYHTGFIWYNLFDMV